MAIQMGRIDGSSIITAVGFDGKRNQSGTLRIELADGTLHDYENCPYLVYKRLVCAKSPGAFFNQHIRGKHF